ncbi:hypothetical protein K110096F8_32440 [Dielma fastidiosa]
MIPNSHKKLPKISVIINYAVVTANIFIRVIVIIIPIMIRISAKVPNVSSCDFILIRFKADISPIR